MILRLDEVEGLVGAKDVSLCISTQDAVDVPLLQELFSKAPSSIKASIHVERKGDYATASLYLVWEKESK